MDYFSICSLTRHQAQRRKQSDCFDEISGASLKLLPTKKEPRTVLKLGAVILTMGSHFVEKRRRKPKKSGKEDTIQTISGLFFIFSANGMGKRIFYIGSQTLNFSGQLRSKKIMAFKQTQGNAE